MNYRLWVLTLGNFTVGTGSLIVAGILPAIAASLDTSVAMAGQLVTIYGLSLAVGAPLLGIATRHVDRRPLMLSGLGIFVLACLLGAFAPNFTMLVLSRVLAGIGAALYTPNAAVLAAHLVRPERRGRAIALVFAGFSLASVVGVPLGTFVGGAFGWRSAFALVGVLALLAMGFLAQTLPHGTQVPSVSARNWFRLFRQKAPMLTVMTTVLGMAGQYALFTYIAALLLQLHGIGPTGLSALLVWFGLAGLLGNTLAGKWVDRMGAAQVAHFGIGILLSAFIMLAFSGASLLLTIVAMGLWGAAAFAVSSAQQTRLVNQDSRLASATLALNASALYVGQAGGAMLGGLAISFIGFPFALWTGIMLLAAALAVSIWESLLPRRKQSEEHWRTLPSSSAPRPR